VVAPSRVAFSAALLEITEDPAEFSNGCRCNSNKLGDATHKLGDATNKLRDATNKLGCNHARCN